MTKGAYYNENDRAKAEWLRHLMEAGAIARGTVDERSIHDVGPDDLRGYDQHHFFAGVGIWSYALRLAGWPDGRPVWTGSCPCGPFSAAGLQKGFTDPRHLWPEWFRLIRERRPHRIFGEQVDAADAWIDLVSTDLEGVGYAVGAPDLPAAGVGGCHIRQRFFWVADADNAQWWSERAPWHDGQWPKARRVKGYGESQEYGPSLGLAHAQGDHGRPEQQEGGAGRGGTGPAGNGPAGGLAHAYGGESGDGEIQRGRIDGQQPAHGVPGQWLADPESGGRRIIWGAVEPGGVRHADRGVAADWLLCRDGLWRPVEPGASPLVDEAPGRLGRLRGYGDGIDAATAQAFIEAYLDVAP